MKNVPGTAIDRRTFITLSAATAGLVLYPDTLLFGQTSTGITANQTSTASQAAASPAATKPAQRPDPLKPELVKEFVIAAHVDLDKTKALLTETPALLNATWDWGAGDFEMAIGGAGHMGRRDIALFLISQGGRFDLFVAAMLGRLDVVKPMLAAFPHLANSRGPHGIPLMVHAQKGGQEAAEVAAFLESLKAQPA
ncbi:MAG TPA: hypothetical protein VE054_04710 [Blattabacteriaceae bacterium]|nr:hypothetical protein [Blattabacteriaceae bacterium]